MEKIIILFTLLMIVSCDSQDSSFYKYIEQVNTSGKVKLITVRQEPKENIKEYYRKWEKLGETYITKEEVKSISDELRQAYENAKGTPIVECFSPRHILLLENGTELLICCECGKLKIIKEQEQSSFFEIRLERKTLDKIANKYNLEIETP